MSKSRGSSFSSWILVRAYGALTTVVLLVLVASFVFETVVNQTTALGIAGLWVLMTVYAIVSRLSPE